MSRPRERREITLARPIPPNLPYFNRDFIKRARRVVDYPDTFTELMGTNRAGAGERVRRRRPEFLEVIAKCLMVIGLHLDRKTFRIGTQRPDGTCAGLGLKRIALETGLSLRRVRRHFPELERWAVHSKYPCDELETPRQLGGGRVQTHRGYNAVRVVDDRLCRRLGFTAKKIAKARKAGSDAWERRKAKPLSPLALRKLDRAIRAGLANQERAAADERRREQRNAEQLARLAARLRPPDNPSKS